LLKNHGADAPLRKLVGCLCARNSAPKNGDYVWVHAVKI
jgi:hypothetical protein